MTNTPPPKKKKNIQTKINIKSPLIALCFNISHYAGSPLVNEFLELFLKKLLFHLGALEFFKCSGVFIIFNTIKLYN